MSIDRIRLVIHYLSVSLLSKQFAGCLFNLGKDQVSTVISSAEWQRRNCKILPLQRLPTCISSRLGFITTAGIARMMFERKRGIFSSSTLPTIILCDVWYLDDDCCRRRLIVSRVNRVHFTCAIKHVIPDSPLHMKPAQGHSCTWQQATY